MVKMKIIDIDGGIGMEFPNGVDCLKQHGFGMFLESWADGELVITPEAKRAILEHGKEMSLGGIAFFDQKMIGFMQNEIPFDGISVNGKSKDWIRELPEA